MAEIQFNRYMRESKRKPVPLVMSDDLTVMIPVVGGKVALDAPAHAAQGNLRTALAMIFGEEAWPLVEPEVDKLPDIDALKDFTRDVMGAVGISGDDTPPGDGPR